MKVTVELSYQSNTVTVAINENFRESAPLHAAEPKGVRAFQFTWGVDQLPVCGRHHQYHRRPAEGVASGPCRFRP